MWLFSLRMVTWQISSILFGAQPVSGLSPSKPKDCWVSFFPCLPSAQPANCLVFNKSSFRKCLFTVLKLQIEVNIRSVPALLMFVHLAYAAHCRAGAGLGVLPQTQGLWASEHPAGGMGRGHGVRVHGVRELAICRVGDGGRQKELVRRKLPSKVPSSTFRFNWSLREVLIVQWALMNVSTVGGILSCSFKWHKRSWARGRLSALVQHGAAISCENQLRSGGSESKASCSLPAGTSAP